jgi:MFS transporter, putative metabolite:H+ symporter
MAPSMQPSKRAVSLAVLVAALGYFVDIYDLILFSILRMPSLTELGVPPEQRAEVGLELLNWQMAGMLTGGVLWGVIADKRGRLAVLFGSIIMYSIANIANGMVQDLTQYRVLRFVAGVGLAGELGAGITLVAEIMKKETRGWGTTIIASIGLLGAVVGSLVATRTYWRNAYYIGGALGFALLVLRLGVAESGIYRGLTERKDVRRGDLLHLFGNGRRVLRYLAVIMVGVPIWYVLAILITLAPEMATALGVPNPPKNAADAVLWCYSGGAIGDLASGALSQILRSRRRAMAIFIGITAIALVLYFTVGGQSLTAFYVCCFMLGFGFGYWAVFVTNAAEQFGTNLRGTVATTAPNFVRGMTVPVAIVYTQLAPTQGKLNTAIWIGVVLIAVAFVSVWSMKETYGKDLDYTED